MTLRGHLLAELLSLLLLIALHQVRLLSLQRFDLTLQSLNTRSDKT